MAVTLRSGLLVAMLGILAGCGGGGGGQGTGTGSTTRPGGGSFTPGVFQPSSTFAGRCTSPRSGDLQGTAADEKNFLRSWTHELYLWYSEVQDRNPSSYSVLEYFDLLKTTAITSSGQPKDKFHFTFDTDAWIALTESGVQAGYGAQWLIVGDDDDNPATPRQVFIAYTEPGSPATASNLTRGVEVTSADGVSVAQANTQRDIDQLNAAFFPDSTGQSHTFAIRELSGTTRTVTMTSANVTSTPVQNVRTISTASGPVGYLLFNDHIATSEQALINAINTLDGQNIQDLILDIRYNGGGLLDIASELAYMIAGSATSGRTFEKLVFNDQHPTTNPVTAVALAPIPFHTTTQIDETHRALPTLGLPRVYVLTTDSTCSASESIINSLRGIDIDVYQIGSRTCGKPYGFYPRDNCGTTYFSIQFKGINAKDFGDYADGFSPTNASTPSIDELPGCRVADDRTRALGDQNEGMLRAALDYRMSNNQVCPAPPPAAVSGTSLKPGESFSISDGVVPKSPWRENRILTD